MAQHRGQIFPVSLLEREHFHDGNNGYSTYELLSKIKTFLPIGRYALLTDVVRILYPDLDKAKKQQSRVKRILQHYIIKHNRNLFIRILK